MSYDCCSPIPVGGRPRGNHQGKWRIRPALDSCCFVFAASLPDLSKQTLAPRLGPPTAPCDDGRGPRQHGLAEASPARVTAPALPRVSCSVKGISVVLKSEIGDLREAAQRHKHLNSGGLRGCRVFFLRGEGPLFVRRLNAHGCRGRLPLTPAFASFHCDVRTGAMSVSRFSRG